MNDPLIAMAHLAGSKCHSILWDSFTRKHASRSVCLFFPYAHFGQLLQLPGADCSMECFVCNACCFPCTLPSFLRQIGICFAMRGSGMEILSIMCCFVCWGKRAAVHGKLAVLPPLDSTEVPMSLNKVVSRL